MTESEVEWIQKFIWIEKIIKEISSDRPTIYNEIGNFVH